MKSEEDRGDIGEVGLLPWAYARRMARPPAVAAMGTRTVTRNGVRRQAVNAAAVTPHHGTICGKHDQGIEITPRNRPQRQTIGPQHGPWDPTLLQKRRPALTLRVSH
jgi:hypothetical protein